MLLPEGIFMAKGSRNNNDLELIFKHFDAGIGVDFGISCDTFILPANVNTNTK